MAERKGHIGEFIAVGAVVLLWVGILSFFSPEEIVAYIGVEQGYFLIFFLALVGISAFTSASFYTTLFVLASSGEFNPILLGLAAAPASTIGDTVMFFLGSKSRSVIPGKWLKRVSYWLGHIPHLAVSAIVYVYTALTPLPQDLLMIATGLSGVRARFILPFVFLGNATFVSLISYLVMTGRSLPWL